MWQSLSPMVPLRGLGPDAPCGPAQPRDQEEKVLVGPHQAGVWVGGTRATASPGQSGLVSGLGSLHWSWALPSPGDSEGLRQGGWGAPAEGVDAPRLRVAAMWGAGELRVEGGRTERPHEGPHAFGFLPPVSTDPGCPERPSVRTLRTRFGYPTPTCAMRWTS